MGRNAFSLQAAQTIFLTKTKQKIKYKYLKK